jgi:hypothetical protein
LSDNSSFRSGEVTSFFPYRIPTDYDKAVGTFERENSMRFDQAIQVGIFNETQAVILVNYPD